MIMWWTNNEKWHKIVNYVLLEEGKRENKSLIKICLSYLKILRVDHMLHTDVTYMKSAGEGGMRSVKLCSSRINGSSRGWTTSSPETRDPGTRDTGSTGSITSRLQRLKGLRA